MAKHQWLSRHQKGIVKRYYENRDTLMHQKLAEIVSELYVCSDDGEAERLWQRARRALENMGVHQGKVERIVEARDLERLADAVNQLF